MDRGTEIKNQIRRVANIVPRGTAPDDCAAMRKKLRKMNVPKTTLKVNNKEEGVFLGGGPGDEKGSHDDV